jgi:hypothetical protein
VRRDKLDIHWMTSLLRPRLPLSTDFGNELVKAAAELVKAMAWPIAVVIVALSFKPRLLSALPSLFHRKLELEGLGFKAKIEQAAAENPATEKLSETPSLDPSPRPAVNIIETLLRDQLKGIAARKRESVLVRTLAQSCLEGGHEFTYNRIFGSQIAELKRLNELGRITVDDAREFFRPSAEQFPKRFWPMIYVAERDYSKTSFGNRDA